MLVIFCCLNDVARVPTTNKEAFSVFVFDPSICLNVDDGKSYEIADFWFVH